MSLLENGPWETWKSRVANHHVVNGVKSTGLINWGVAIPYHHEAWMR